MSGTAGSLGAGVGSDLNGLQMGGLMAGAAQDLRCPIPNGWFARSPTPEPPVGTVAVKSPAGNGASTKRDGEGLEQSGGDLAGQHIPAQISSPVASIACRSDG